MKFVVEKLRRCNSEETVSERCRDCFTPGKQLLVVLEGEVALGVSIDSTKWNVSSRQWGTIMQSSLIVNATEGIQVVLEKSSRGEMLLKLA